MPTFQYKARTKEGESRKGAIEASSYEAALDALQRRDLLILSLRESERPPLWQRPLFLGGGISPKDVAIFMRQLATLFEAKIPVVNALKTLVGETSKSRFRGVIAEMLDDITGGMALSQAMAKHPVAFSSFTINLIRSGEEAGKLEEVCIYLAEYLERSNYLTTKARNSLIYPAFVLTAFVVVIIVMLVTVIPRLASIFEETGQEVPFYTQAVIGLSAFLREQGLVLILLVVAALVSTWRWSYTKRGKIFFHRWQLKFPVLGDLYKKLFMARFADNLHTMIVSGIPIVRALSISAEVVGNEIYRRAILEAAESVKTGSTIAAGLKKTPEIPVLITQMINIGETTGKLDFILGSSAKYYRREVDSLLDNLVALIEPALIIFLGLGVGTLVVAVLVPLYTLVGSI